MLAVVIVVLALLVVSVVVLIDTRTKFATHRERYTATEDDVEAARTHSVATSKGSTLGQAAEHLAPFFPEMVDHFCAGDWRFLGSPVDYVVFDGLTKGAVRRIVLVEVKTGSPRLNARQSQLHTAVTTSEFPVSWLTLNQSFAAPRGRPRPHVIETYPPRSTEA